METTFRFGLNRGSVIKELPSNKLVEPSKSDYSEQTKEKDLQKRIKEEQVKYTECNSCIRRCTMNTILSGDFEIVADDDENMNNSDDISNNNDSYTSEQEDGCKLDNKDDNTEHSDHAANRKRNFSLDEFQIIKTIVMFKKQFPASSSEFEEESKNIDRIAKLEEDCNEIKATLSRMEKRQMEILIILKKITCDDLPLTSNKFPITTMEDLKKVDKLVSENKESYVRVLQAIIKGNIAKNFDSVIGKCIIPDLNFDGLNGKEAFKQFKALNDALYDAIKTEGCTDKTYAATIRNCFRVQKGRLAKQKFDNKQKTENKNNEENTTNKNDVNETNMEVI